jgi:hypothetical protein
MTDLTPLDKVHAAMQSDPEDDAARLGFFERLADSELFLMLQATPTGDEATVTPEIFETGGQSYVLVFDREERLAAFSGDVTPFVALSGRNIAEMLAGQQLGLGVNLGVAPSAILLPDEAVRWLHETLGNRPEVVETRVDEVSPPRGLPENLIRALDAKLAAAMGLAASAYLVAVTYRSGARGHMLAFLGAVPQAETALARAVAEALTFSGIEAGVIDVGFFRLSDPIVAKLERVGLRFDLPQPQETVIQERSAPGMDPARPPKLK